MITHYTELVERHEIIATLPKVMDMARAAAQDWLDAEGQSADIAGFKRADGTTGVRFEIVVAHAVGPAGELHRWRWGARWRDWLHKFAALHRAHTLAPAHPVAPGAHVIQLRGQV